MFPLVAAIGQTEIAMFGGVSGHRLLDTGYIFDAREDTVSNFDGGQFAFATPNN